MRETGYYWVKMASLKKWEIAYWVMSDKWLIAGYEQDFDDLDFAEIDENRITRP